MAEHRLINGVWTDQFSDHRLVNGVWSSNPSPAGGPTTHEGALTLAAFLGDAQTNIATMGASVTFNANLADSPANNAVFESSITNNFQLSALYSQDTSKESSISFSLGLSESSQGNHIANADLPLAVQLGDTTTVNAAFAASAIYAQLLAMTLTAEQIGQTEGSLTLNIDLGTVTNATGVFGADSLFSQTLALNLAGGKEIASAVSFALTSGMTQSSLITIEGQLLFGHVLDITNGTDAEFAAALVLNQQLAFTAIQQGIIEAGLSLSCIQSVSIVGQKLVAGLVTPSGRKISVSYDAGSLSVNNDPRTNTISVDSSTIDVDPD